MRRKSSVSEVYNGSRPVGRLDFLNSILEHAKENVNAVGRLDLAVGNGPLARATIEINSMIREAVRLEAGVKAQAGILEGLKFKSYTNKEKKAELEAKVGELSKKVQERVAEIAENGRQIVIKALGEARLAMNGNGQKSEGGNGQGAVPAAAPFIDRMADLIESEGRLTGGEEQSQKTAAAPAEYPNKGKLATPFIAID